MYVFFSEMNECVAQEPRDARLEKKGVKSEKIYIQYGARSQDKQIIL